MITPFWLYRCVESSAHNNIYITDGGRISYKLKKYRSENDVCHCVNSIILAVYKTAFMEKISSLTR